MPVITESANLGDLLKYEAPSLYSRDAVTVASGQNLTLGTVVGLKTADGKVHALDPAATDGTETAAGVLLQAVDATSADAPGLMLARHAIVSDNALVWPAGITTGQQIAAINQLKDRGLLVRKGV